MDNNNLNINNLQESKISEKTELTEKITTEEEQYIFLKKLNRKLTLFKKQSDQSEKNAEQTEQTMRR